MPCPSVVLELDKYVEAGCVVTIFAPVALEERVALLEEGKSRKLDLRHIELQHAVGSTIHRADLEAILRSRPYANRAPKPRTPPSPVPGALALRGGRRAASL
jgi:hypothetical protein